MGFLEIKLYNDIKEKFSLEVEQKFKQNFLRFLDDCFLLWNTDLPGIENIITLLNDLNVNIRFTSEINTVCIPFLDVKVIRQNCNVITDIYHKATDSYQYIKFSSCHPKHVKINIPFILANRITRIVSDVNLRDVRFRELRENLIKRDYPIKLVEGAIYKYKSLTHKSRIVEQAEKEGIPIVHTFYPNDRTFFNIQNFIPILNNSDRMREVLKNKKVLKSYRQGPNLKRLLTHSQLNKINNVMKCNDSRCGICKTIIEGTNFTFIESGKTITVNHNMSCSSGNVIYVLQCNGCNQNYIGETGDTLRHRSTVHRQHINHPDKAPLYVSKHISNCSKGQKDKFRIMPIKKCFSDSAFRKSMEDNLISHFKPSLNKRTC